MNILTGNRIIEKGDEYRDNGTWKPVKTDSYGLQVMFTDYKEVRRPTEQGSQVARHGSAKPAIEGSIPSPASKLDLSISPDSERALNPPETSQEGSAVPAVTAKAEKVNVPTPTPSGVGATLPTVISAKAHKEEGVEHLVADEDSHLCERDHVGVMPVSLRSKSGAVPLDIHIPYPTKTVGALLDPCYWIGRNGTFEAKALNMHKTVTGKVRICPQGKRGEARNAMIEFPVEIIPQLIDWLKQHQP